jgi:hypothetical protein
MGGKFIMKEEMGVKGNDKVDNGSLVIKCKERGKK